MLTISVYMFGKFACSRMFTHLLHYKCLLRLFESTNFLGNKRRLVLLLSLKVWNWHPLKGRWDLIKGKT